LIGELSNTSQKPEGAERSELIYRTGARNVETRYFGVGIAGLWMVQGSDVKTILAVVGGTILSVAFEGQQ